MASTGGHDQEIALVENEVLRLEAVIAQLQARRSALLQRLNAIRPPTRVLPPEVLALIFKHALPPVFPEIVECNFPEDDNFSSILALSHVSSYWRQVAWSAPQLWSSLQMIITQSNDRSILPILDLHFRNARDIRLNLDLIFDVFHDEGNIELHPLVLQPSANSIEQFLSEATHASKVQSLRLSNILSEWSLNTIPEQLPNLKHLLICHFWPTVWDEDSLTFSDHSFEELNSLRNIVFSDLKGTVSLPSSITHLEVSRTPIDIVVSLLRQCPNLLKFTSSCAMPVFDSDGAIILRHSDDIITCPHLQELTWSAATQDEDVMDVFQYHRFPALRALSLEKSSRDWGDPPELVPSLQPFFPTLGNILNLRLSIHKWWSVAFFQDTFQRTPALQTLDVAINGDGIRTLLRCLSLTINDSPQYLPYLTALAIRDTEQNTNRRLPDADFSYELFRFCRARQRPNYRLKIQVKEALVSLAPGVREELYQMVQQGFQVDAWDEAGSLLSYSHPV